MNSFINHIEIKNFKSIQHLEIDGLRKINLFIGKPNVGKSNILEALSLFTVPYFNHSNQLTDLIRAENLLEIFHSGNLNEPAFVTLKEDTTYYISSLSYENNGINEELKYENALARGNSKSSLGRISNLNLTFDSKFNWKQIGSANDLNNRVKRYIYKKGVNSDTLRTSYLFPPFGTNLLYVLELQKELREVFASWFKQYGLRLVLDKASNSLKVMKDNGADVFIVPYSLIADTLQRIIFYKTAIVSNKNSVLIFEEPEAHAYPPYIAEFTQEVINSETNQFFMATHSPIVVNDFLENAIDDLAIFMVDYKDDQTKVKPLSREEIHDVYKYGVDLFFNNEAYPV